MTSPAGRDTIARMDSPLAWDGLLNRRDLLRLGCLGVAGSLLPAPLRATPPRSDGTARSVILL